MEKQKKQWVDSILGGLESADPAANRPDEAYLESLKARLVTRLQQTPAFVSTWTVWAAAAAFALLVAANVLAADVLRPFRPDRVETFMEQEAIYPIIPLDPL